MNYIQNSVACACLHNKNFLIMDGINYSIMYILIATLWWSCAKACDIVAMQFTIQLLFVVLTSVCGTMEHTQCLNRGLWPCGGKHQQTQLSSKVYTNWVTLVGATPMHLLLLSSLCDKYYRKWWQCWHTTCAGRCQTFVAHTSFVG